MFHVGALTSVDVCGSTYGRHEHIITVWTDQGSVLQRVWNVLVKPAKNSNTAHSTRVLTLVRTRYTFAALRGACVREKIQLP